MKRTEKASRRIPEEKAASKEEIAAAVEALTPEESFRLKQYALWRVGGLGRAAKSRDWEDLLREAISATYDGRRRWNKDAIDLRRHLEGAMRSISSHWRDQFNPDEADLEAEIIQVSPEGEEFSPLSDAPTLAPSPERTLEVKEEIERIDAIAGQNSLPWLIWDGLRGGMDGPEIRDALSISQQEYDTAMKWLRRKVRPRQSKEGK